MDREAFDAACHAIRSDRQQGAAALARQGLAACRDSALGAPAASAAALQAELLARAAHVAALRPAMTPVAVLPGAWRDDVAGLAPRRGLTWLRRAAASLAQARIAASHQAGPRAARRLAARLPAAAELLTLSDSGTVRTLLATLAAQDRPRVTVAESRPGGEGRALAAFSAQLGLAATLITEAQLGQAAWACDAAVIGADTLDPHGNAINKTGSYPLALCAHAAGIPLYVVAESFKRRPANLPPPPLETGEPAELGPLPDGVAARNVAFEWVPAALIAASIDEGDG